MEKIATYLLESFVVASESRNLVEAAEKLKMTQPTLSRHLTQLEEYLPYSLFQIQGRKKVLTRYGQSLYETLKVRFSDLQKLIEGSVLQFSKAEQATLRIAGRREVLSVFYDKLNFAGTLQFDFTSGILAIEALLKREADICINQRLPNSHLIVARPVFRRGICFVVSKKLVHRKPALNASSMGDILINLPCLNFGLNPSYVEILAAHLGVNMNDIRQRRICSDWQAIAQWAEMSLGWALVPSASDMDEKILWKIEIPETIIKKTQFYLLYLRELTSLPWFREFISRWPEV